MLKQNATSAEGAPDLISKGKSGVGKSRPFDNRIDVPIKEDAAMAVTGLLPRMEAIFIGR